MNKRGKFIVLYGQNGIGKRHRRGGLRARFFRKGKRSWGLNTPAMTLRLRALSSMDISGAGIPSGLPRENSKFCKWRIAFTMSAWKAAYTTCSIAEQSLLPKIISAHPLRGERAYGVRADFIKRLMRILCAKTSLSFVWRSVFFRSREGASP